jgi:hypothetical protein
MVWVRRAEVPNPLKSFWGSKTFSIGREGTEIGIVRAELSEKIK